MPVQIQIGSSIVQRIVEQEAPFFDALQFFPTLTSGILAENRAWLRPTFLDAEDRLVLCIQSYLVQTPHHNILIDTCVGNHKPRPARAFWHMLNSDRYEKNLAVQVLPAGFSNCDRQSDATVRLMSKTGVSRATSPRLTRSGASV